MPPPATLTCPIGKETWPLTSFSCLVDTRVSRITSRHIHLSCPVGHNFTLATAFREKTFSKEQATRILNSVRNKKV